MDAIGCSDLTSRDQRNSRTFHLWFFVTMATFLTATILIKLNLVVPAIGWTLTIATALFSIGMLRSYVIFLREADELLRKIHVDGLALGFGVGAVFMVVYRLCERLGAPQLDTSDPLLVMVSFWAIGQWIGLRRYAPTEAQS